MKPSIIRGVIAAFFLAALAACGKREIDPKTETSGAQKHEPKIVALTKENLAQVEIKTEPVRRGDLEMTFKAAGTVTENLNKTARITPTLEGRITQLNFDINDHVKEGDILAFLQTPELLGKPLELKAPIEGVVTERQATVGELAGKETQIYTISDPADLWVVAEVKERDIAAVHLGEEAAFTVLAYPNEIFRGKVVRVGNRVESASRTLDVRIAARNEDGRLKPGMFADVEIATTAVKDTLIIPDKALQSDADGQIVFVARDGAKFEKRPLKIGLEQHSRVQVLEGLKEGEKVVTEGSFILKSEMLKGELGEE
jgi:multidrug efflux pump subunit AcrA (membrane-fusion protein)